MENHSNAPTSTPVAAEPAKGGRGWLWALAAVAVAVGAGFAAVQLKWVPPLSLGTSKSRPPVAPEKRLVRYVLVEPHRPGERPPAPVYIADVRGDNELNLSFEVGGTVELIGPVPGENWDDGAQVKKGAVLARLKPDDFINRVKAAQSRADLARVTYERLGNLVKMQAIPQQQFDQAAAEKKAADANLAAAEQALNETVLHAPEDATILGRMVSPAEIVAPGRPVLRVSSLRRMSVDVGIPDTAISQVQVGQEVPLVFSALAGRSFTGRVSEVGVAGEEGSRLFRVKLKVPNPDGLIKSGMTASVSFAPADKSSPDAVWVPLAALTGAAGGSGQLAVFVIDADAKARKRPVETDEIAGNRILVTRGLKPGDKVVVAGVSTLFDGAAADARPAEEGFK